jgi:CarD family transcriptional regulator
MMSRTNLEAAPRPEQDVVKRPARKAAPRQIKPPQAKPPQATTAKTSAATQAEPIQAKPVQVEPIQAEPAPIKSTAKSASIKPKQASLTQPPTPEMTAEMTDHVETLEPIPDTEVKSNPEPKPEPRTEVKPPETRAEELARTGMPAPGPRPVLPQRAIAKAENFKEGDFVVYPTHGVGKVERIASEEIAGHKLELIHITFDENRMTLRVPVNKARTAGLRKLSSRKQFDEVLAALKGRARIKRTMWSRRAQEYEAKINSGDPMAIAEVVRDLHRNAGQPDQSFSERQIFEAALERLAAEHGALEGVDKQTAIDQLMAHLKAE